MGLVCVAVWEWEVDGSCKAYALSQISSTSNTCCGDYGGCGGYDGCDGYGLVELHGCAGEGRRSVRCDLGDPSVVVRTLRMLGDLWVLSFLLLL